VQGEEGEEGNRRLDGDSDSGGCGVDVGLCTQALSVA